MNTVAATCKHNIASAAKSVHTKRQTTRMWLPYVAPNATVAKNIRNKPKGITKHPWASHYFGTVDGGERVRGFRQLFGQVGTPSGTPQAGGPLQGSHLPTCSPYVIAVFRS